MVLKFFLTKLKISFNFAFFSYFLYDIFINKVKKLEVAVSNPIMEDIHVFFSLSLFPLGFFSFFSFTFLSLSLSLSLSLC